MNESLLKIGGAIIAVIIIAAVGISIKNRNSVKNKKSNNINNYGNMINSNNNGIQNKMDNNNDK